MNNHKRWTNEEDLVIISMRKEGKTLKEIATKLNRTYGSIVGRVHYLINTCSIEKKKSNNKTSRLNSEVLLGYIANSPGNLHEAFRKYAKDYNLSPKYIKNRYYAKNRKGKQRIKDSGAVFTIVSKTGHTLNNSKNTNVIHKSNLWQKIKTWLYGCLLS